MRLDQLVVRGGFPLGHVIVIQACGLAAKRFQVVGRRGKGERKTEVWDGQVKTPRCSKYLP